MVDFENDIKNCVQALQQSGLILYPTDTIWGIGCDATNETAIEKVYAIKERPKNKSLIVLLADARDILQYVAAPPPDIIEIVENFERPTTIIFDQAIGIAENAITEDGSIAIRVTTDPFCKALIKRARVPLISTSANISGQATACTFASIDKRILSNVDYIVRHRQNEDLHHKPSLIVRVSDDGAIIQVR
jgi:L-threonylcarbamoyladenylate synthase